MGSLLEKNVGSRWRDISDGYRDNHWVGEAALKEKFLRLLWLSRYHTGAHLAEEYSLVELGFGVQKIFTSFSWSSWFRCQGFWKV